MASSCYDCVIGLLYRSHHGTLTNLRDLVWSIKDTQEFNESCRKYGMNEIVSKEYTLRDYADRRKSTNLTRFSYCPMCGKKIDWKAIGRLDDEKRPDGFEETDE